MNSFWFVNCCYFCPPALPELPKKRRCLRLSAKAPGRDADEEQDDENKDDEEEEEDEDDEEFQPSEGSENEMETEMLDYI